MGENHSPEAWHPGTTEKTISKVPSLTEDGKTAQKPEEEDTPGDTGPLSLLDGLRVCTVLEDTADQLSILNYIMPIYYEERQGALRKNRESTSEGKTSEKLSPLTDSSKLSTPFITKEEPKLLEAKPGLQLIKEISKMQDLAFKKPTRQTILTMETLKKIQMDRQFFSDVVYDTMQELNDSGQFTSLLNALSKEKENKTHFYDLITREEKGRKQIKSLQKQLLNVKRERQAEIQSQNEYIAHLKDQLQEMKAKTSMENRYLKMNTELQVSQTVKKCSKAEELMLEEIEKVRQKTEDENRIHQEIEVFLRRRQQTLEDKLEFWMEKFDKDTETKQNELNALKVAKATDLMHLQELAKTIREYEQVIIEDRLEKETYRKKREKEALELKSIIKLQAWWRGTMVRREIGTFRLPRKGVDTKDQKKGKGKEKDKRKGKK
ncbi:dynein regulatory complex protein 9 isoform X1 [Sorex araneus]|uniref:dynein regulatory complex protein 9 isoform X1 n=1 Tax=Sorex araneus TaxID=42254 RepID=UPI0024340693|nr:dynein regulatory complex protein 9 isoform X1 [Sorex araneus]XP_054985741.1 dynein regulatory complex protein 9 isoform X1 [Sorex araneus]